MSTTQAMILAAGFSTRLRPLTTQVPKPLLPFLHRRLLDFVLEYLTQQGIRSVSVNVHHGRHPFEQALHDNYAPKIEPYFESRIRGTGGGIKGMHPFVKTQTFFVLNSDFLTDIDLKKAIAFHKKRKALATLVLVESPEVEKYGPTGIDENDRIVSTPYATTPSHRSGVFTGIHILEKEIFDEMPDEDNFCIVRDVYVPLISKGAPVFGWLPQARWFDVGEMQAYVGHQFKLLQEPLDWMKPSFESFKRIEDQVFLAPDAEISDDAKIHGPAMICGKATIGPRSVLSGHVLVGPGCKIAADSSLSHVIVFPGTDVRTRSSLHGGIFTHDELIRVT